MDSMTKPHTKYSDKINNSFLVVLVISLAFVIVTLLFVKIGVVDREAKAMNAKLADRIQRMEDEMQATVQNMVQAMLKSTGSKGETVTVKRRAAIFGKLCVKLERYHFTEYSRTSRNRPPKIHRLGRLILEIMIIMSGIPML